MFLFPGEAEMYDTATVQGRVVLITGPNAHPFRCTECSNCFREHRHAARCCKASSEDLRSGDVREFDAVFEAMKVQEDLARWDAERAAYHYECSCGESYREIAHARNCRKCQTYSQHGFCTEVFDRNTGEEVWVSPGRENLEKRLVGEALKALAADFMMFRLKQEYAKPLTHNPFAALLGRN